MNTLRDNTNSVQLEIPGIEIPNINLNKPKNILLIEPSYNTKYPPLGLMKISTYHKEDYVVFYKGTKATLRDQDWDIIYITTMFTFQWKKTI